MAAAASAAQQQENSGHVRTVAKHLLAHLNLTFGGTQLSQHCLTSDRKEGDLTRDYLPLILLGAMSVSASAVAMQRRCLDFLEAISTMGIVDKESFAHALKLLTQHLCTSVPDRNEFRQCAGSGVSRLLSIMSAEGQETFLPWLLKFARNAKAGFRTFALDAAGAILAVRSAINVTRFCNHSFCLKWTLDVVAYSTVNEKIPFPTPLPHFSFGSLPGCHGARVIGRSSRMPEAPLPAHCNVRWALRVEERLTPLVTPRTADDGSPFSLFKRRCSDKAPAVRAKALSQLATLLSVQQQSEETKNILGRATASLWETCHASVS